MIEFANNYLAGSLITLLIPGLVFVAIAIWYTRTVMRREHDRDREEAAAPGSTPEGETSRAVH